MPMEAWREVALGLHLVDKIRGVLITKRMEMKERRKGRRKEGKDGWVNRWMDDGWMGSE